MGNEEFKGYVEVREIKKFYVKAKTKIDAEKILRLAINSQDEIIKFNGVPRSGVAMEILWKS